MKIPSPNATALVMVALLSLAAAVSSAEEVPTLEHGSRVRVTTAGSYPTLGKPRVFEGRVVALNDSVIALDTGASARPQSIQRADIALLEVNTRKGRRGLGAIIGMTVGAAVGMSIGFAAGDDPEPTGLGAILDPGPHLSAGEKAGFGALIGAPIGM